MEDLIATSKNPSDKKWKVFHLSSSNDAGDVIMIHPSKPPKIIEIKSIDVRHTKPPIYYFSFNKFQHERIVELNNTIKTYYFVYFIWGLGWKWMKVQKTLPKSFAENDGLLLKDFLIKECGMKI